MEGDISLFSNKCNDIWINKRTDGGKHRLPVRMTACVPTTPNMATYQADP